MQHYLDPLFSISRWIRGVVRKGWCSHRLGARRWCIPSFEALHTGGHQARSMRPVGMNPGKLIQRTVVDQHSPWNLWECWHAGHIPCPLTEIQHFHAGTGFFTMQKDVRRKGPDGAVPVDPVSKIPWKWFSPFQIFWSFESWLKKRNIMDNGCIQIHLKIRPNFLIFALLFLLYLPVLFHMRFSLFVC